MDLITEDRSMGMTMTKLLLFGPLRANIDINARDKYGWTPFGIDLNVIDK